MEDVIVVENLVKKFGDFEAVKGISFPSKKERSLRFLGQTAQEKPPPYIYSPPF